MVFSFSLFSTREKQRGLALSSELPHNFCAYCCLSLAPPVADRGGYVAVVLPSRYTWVGFIIPGVSFFSDRRLFLCGVT